MSRDAITKLEQERQKKQIEQTLEEASWNIPKLLKINARLVKEKHEQAEQIARLTNALGAITYINPSERCAENKMIEIAKEALEHIDGIGNVIVWKGNSDE